MKYTVQSGDTLVTIAATQRVTLGALLDANPQCKANPNVINVGDTLVIPDRDEPIADSATADWLGLLSARYETGGRGPGTVSTGIGDAGGVSYGSYQMTSAGGGTVGRFVAQSDFPWCADFAGLTPGAADFTEKWKEIASRQPKEFQGAQHQYIKRTHFDPLAARVRADDGLDITARCHALQNVIWSTAVQHGPNTPVVHRALAQLKQSGALTFDQPDFDRKLIMAIYAERGRKDEQGTLVYFARNSPAVQQGVANRFVAEQRDALKMIDDEA